MSKDLKTKRLLWIKYEHEFIKLQDLNPSPSENYDQNTRTLYEVGKQNKTLEETKDRVIL